MIKMKPYAPSNRIVIRADSIDEEISDDIEDDVFIRDSRSAKMREDNGVKRPLMAPRRIIVNGKISNPVPIMKKNRRRCWKCCEPFCYGLAALTVLVALIFLAAFILTLFPIPLQKLKIWLKKEPQLAMNVGTIGSNFGSGSNYEKDAYGNISPEFVPCTQMQVHRVWTKVFPRINSESPVRYADLNGDGLQDIIFGYGIDDSIQYEGFPLPRCTSARQNEEIACEGGVIALNGVSGELIWQRWTAANIFTIICTTDIDKDGFTDCMVAGRGGIVMAINGRNGEIIWNLRELDVETSSPIIIDLYTINTIRDIDEDNCPDIIAVHLEERKSSRSGHIKLISGRTGKVIRSLPTPFKEEIFVPIQMITQEDGTELLLITTGGQSSAGGIYTIRLHTLMEFRSDKEFYPIFKTNYSGFIVPAILTDITGDNIDDIIVASFNSTVYAFDGKNYSIIWNYTFPASESVSAIVPGHFNHDNITDFMIKYNTGPGFPVYYYSQTTILNGLNGTPLLQSMMTDSGGPNSLLAGMSISQTVGGDFFLHWQVQCRDKYDAKDAYEFIPNSDVFSQARADVCLLRYNTTTVLKLYAIARHIESPGAVIFNSDDMDIHLNRTEFHQLSKERNSVSPLKHPKMLKKLQTKNKNSKSNILPSVTSVVPNEIPLRKNYKKLQNKIFHTEDVGDLREKLRKPIYNSKYIKLPSPSRDEEDSNDHPQYVDPLLKSPFVYAPYNELPDEREFKDYENETPQRLQQEEYDLLYNDEQSQPVQNQLNERPIRLRAKYPPGNRDVRSKIADYGLSTAYHDLSSKNQTESENKGTDSSASERTSTNSNEPALNLWDLEIEKEEEEAIKETHKYDYNVRHGRDDQTLTNSVDLSQSVDNTNNMFLTSITSTGILMDSLDKSANSSIDFTFIVNVRESETYPPLFLPQDLSCVEEKLSSYKSFINEDLVTLQKQIINQCLGLRIKNISPNQPRFESQVVVTRISISCSCGILESGEICSKLNNLDKQKWTQFMGNSGNGLY